MFRCNVCSYSTRYKSWIVKHFRIHTAEALLYISEDESHADHEGTSVFCCSVCSFSSPTIEEVCNHMDLHSDQFQYVCTDHLKFHSDTHSYPCNICCEVFRSIGEYALHGRKHGKKSPYTSSISETEPLPNPNLSFTIARKRRYECHLCKKEFTRKCSLQRHYRRIHKDFISCPNKYDLPKKRIVRK
ncbi:Zinc finger protein 26 like protein [Argiope bruennichi]|uniref:Zinc finger protein 26 like protein n=1 Tax=Argiope bruennichi TaxID=94029 RepID=A0A8T0F6H0_ARGBR|nr:Zinc finger protein 26 like protein [Argiope bruennichi]